MTGILLALTTFGSTTLGGVFALRHQDRLHRILGFTAGILLGVVAFDLLPEIHQLTNATGSDFTAPMIALTAGFLVFHIAEKLVLIHTAHEREYAPDHRHPHIGLTSALALSAHSFFDGVGIGLAFQVSTHVGLAVAIAVIAHDFADGLNTVTLMLVHGHTTARSWRLLLLDATTPLLGAASTLLFRVPDRDLLLYLGFFAGFLIYIGASDILPEAHADHPSGRALLLTVAGVALIFLVTRFGL
ncbi:divalent cation transporter [Mycobacterium antarcticum]|uniref:ZIP family metal transporter n=1 Tax=Mycolicibacterium sp. TUM20983 TaxID=3023369 RepID=UPI00238735AD|nr:ZIP family metal transporter [Mycolicibacterium sp. TUM20983]GLP72916.1 divalent cation transporter [Mycolicibacterium sp. TUM20983]